MLLGKVSNDVQVHAILDDSQILLLCQDFNRVHPLFIGEDQLGSLRMCSEELVEIALLNVVIINGAGYLRIDDMEAS